jgi:hypothetical protein
MSLTLTDGRQLEIKGRANRHEKVMGNQGIDSKRLTAIILRTVHLEFAKAFAMRENMRAGP